MIQRADYLKRHAAAPQCRRGDSEQHHPHGIIVGEVPVILFVDVLYGGERLVGKAANSADLEVIWSGPSAAKELTRQMRGIIPAATARG
jgi:hypothetical protein